MLPILIVRMTSCYDKIWYVLRFSTIGAGSPNSTEVATLRLPGVILQVLQIPSSLAAARAGRGERNEEGCAALFEAHSI
jgi:hypothetical protein